MTPNGLLLFYMWQRGIVKEYTVYPPLNPLNSFSLPPSIFRQGEDSYPKTASGQSPPMHYNGAERSILTIYVYVSNYLHNFRINRKQILVLNSSI